MTAEAIRELVATVEYLRMVCEFADGLTAKDTILLTKGMCVGIDVGRKYGALLPDYQTDSFAAEVRALPDRKIEELPPPVPRTPDPDPELVQLLDECQAAMRQAEAELRLAGIHPDLCIALDRLQSRIRTFSK